MIDFGCAKTYKDGEIMKLCCGSIFYMAPEVFFQHYTEKCDIWSIGVVIFALYTGTFPFDHEDDQVIQFKILHKKLKFSKDQKKLIKRPVRKFLKKILVK